jgi:hypothetical protein
MTVLSIADACRLLGIDPKTLRRWLALAHLDLQPHPADARTHGLREDHLRQLARLHQRSLLPLPSHELEPVSPTACPAPALPVALLSLPQTLAALQAQLTALQQQVTEISHRLEQGVRSSAAAPQAHTTQPASRTTPAAARAPRPASAASTPPRKPVHVIPRVEWDGAGHYVVMDPKHGMLSFAPDTPAWVAWLAEQSSFRFVGKGGHFSAHHEWRVPNGAWRAHRHIRNHGSSLRLAPTQELTLAVLEQAAAMLQTHLNELGACLLSFRVAFGPASFRHVPL